MIASLSTVRAQGILGGFFDQKETQIQYYLQQIAANQAYETDLNKGYSIVKNGTNTISGFKINELTLHQGHYDSLKIVSPKVRNYSRIKSIITLQQQIIIAHDHAYPQLSAQLIAQELAQYNQAYNVLLDAAARDLEELQLVITDGKLQMTDDERIAAIDKLYVAMSNRYGAFVQMNNNCLAVAAALRRDSKDAQMMQTLH